MMRWLGIVVLEAFQFQSFQHAGLALHLFLQMLDKFALPGHHVVQLLDLMLKVGDVGFEFFHPLGNFICHERILPAHGREVEASLALRYT
jgi:hypothetical protein